MKKLFIVAMLLVGMTSFAQNKEDRSRKLQRPNMEKMTPEERTAKRIEKMTKDLNLDAKQQEKLQLLFTEQEATRASQKEEMKKKREQDKEKMDAQKAKMDEKMKAILTPEQAAKWKVSQDKMQQIRSIKRGDTSTKE